MTVLDAFAAEAAATQRTIEQIDGPGAWQQPGLGQWTVAELVAHLIRAADRLTAYIDQPVEGTDPACDRVSYFEFDIAAAAAAVADRSRADAARIGTSALLDTFAIAWRTTADLVKDAGPDRLTHTLRGPMRVEEYLATRVLELTVHHMDLCRALTTLAPTTPAALRLTHDILASLLDGDTPEGMDPATFVLAATGREPHPDPRLPLFT